MSMFDWFSKKSNTTAAVPAKANTLADATVPNTPGDRLQVKLAPLPVNHATNRKSERLEHRELLYKVVHDSMIRAGLLAASYKFKVLSLDTRGLQYMIMMDLVNQSAGDTRQLAEIEAMMAQAAKARHGILITAVYWRVSELVTTGFTAAVAVHPLTPPAPLVPAAAKAPGYEPLQQDEVEAFKRALASAATVVPPSEPGRLVTSGRRNPAPPQEFEDTQIVPSDEPGSPLSVTQYGDLN